MPDNKCGEQNMARKGNIVGELCPLRAAHAASLLSVRILSIFAFAHLQNVRAWCHERSAVGRGSSELAFARKSACYQVGYIVRGRVVGNAVGGRACRPA